MKHFAFCCMASICTVFATGETLKAQSPDEFSEHLSRVVTFYRTKVGYRGAYLWKYAADLSAQEGENTATRTSGWTQPPGTPSVGEAYLQAHRLSGNRDCLAAAIECARALVKAQLESGGWNDHFDLGPDGQQRYRYRHGGNPGGRNYTTFDDNKSQSALTLLMHVDEELKFADTEIHEAVEYALERMLAAQYPNGAWPQRYERPPTKDEFPVMPAKFPNNWPRTFPKQKYTGYYTLNDSNMSRIVEMLFEAHRIYDRQDCFDAAEKTGEFFLLAQLPEPQPGWAQQYNSEMEPAWARKFEPPAITGGESQSVMKTLLQLYQFTSDDRFLKPLTTAIPYYRRSLLNDGQLARFYELETNRPLYFTKDYKLTYSDADMPTHYSFKVSSRLDRLEKELNQLRNVPKEKLRPTHRTTRRTTPSASDLKKAQQVVDQLDGRGAWVEDGGLRESDDHTQIINMRTYARNLVTLARAAAGAPE